MSGFYELGCTIVTYGGGLQSDFHSWVTNYVALML